MHKYWTQNYLEPWEFSLNGELQGLTFHYNPRDGFTWQLGWGWYL